MTTYTDAYNYTKASPDPRSVGAAYTALGKQNMDMRDYLDRLELNKKRLTLAEIASEQTQQQLDDLKAERDRRFGFDTEKLGLTKDKYATDKALALLTTPTLAGTPFGSSEERLAKLKELGYSTENLPGADDNFLSNLNSNNFLNTLNRNNFLGNSRGRTSVNINHKLPTRSSNAFSFDPALEASTNRLIAFDDDEEKRLDFSLAQSAKEDDDWWNKRLGYT